MPCGRVEKALEQDAAGISVPLVIEDERRILVGAGYWLSEAGQGNGLATRATHEAVGLAFGDLRLHRVQAETLPHDRRSRRVLEQVGFAQYAAAPS